MELSQEYYKSIVLSLTRGVSKQQDFSNAKPHFLLAILSMIDKGLLMGNMIKLPNEELTIAYNQSWAVYEPEKKPTPIYKPYFHLSSDKFYHVKWNGENRHGADTTPSIKFQRENIDYTFFDIDLWNFLQIPANRDIISDAIVSYFLKS